MRLEESSWMVLAAKTERVAATIPLWSAGAAHLLAQRHIKSTYYAGQWLNDWLVSWRAHHDLINKSAALEWGAWETDPSGLFCRSLSNWLSGAFCQRIIKAGCGQILGSETTIKLQFFLKHFASECPCGYKWAFNTIRVMCGGWDGGCV